MCFVVDGIIIAWDVQTDSCMTLRVIDLDPRKHGPAVKAGQMQGSVHSQ